MNPTTQQQDGAAIQDPEVLNEELVSAILDAPDGHLKNASALSGRFIRRKIRENGFFRRILPFEDVKQSDLSPSIDSEKPWIIEEMEGDQPGSVSLNYDDTPDTQFFRGEKFAVVFYVISTPEFSKNVFELMTCKSDVREITTANALKTIHDKEDTRAIGMVDKIVGSPTGVGASGQQQNFNMQGRISRELYVDNISHIENMNLNSRCPGLFVAGKCDRSIYHLSRHAAGCFDDLPDDLAAVIPSMNLR